ncbi:MAG: helix-turn-helix domain-containing protein [Cyclobacteriaceae bacterium]
MNIDNEFKPERIIMLRNMLQMSQVNFAKKIHISQGALSQIENGKSQISLETLRNISHELNVNCNWVVNGQGNIFMNGEAATSKPKDVKKVVVKPGGTKKPGLPLVKSSDLKKYVKKYGDPDFIKDLDMYLIPGYEEGDIRLFEVPNEDMAPSLAPGEIAICESLDDHTALENGTLVVIVTKEGVHFRRVHFYANEKHVLILKSDSRKVKNLNIHHDKVDEIWVVKGKITSGFASAGKIDSRRIERLESSLDGIRKEIKKLIRS